MTLRVREARDDERPFIVDSWVETFAASALAHSMELRVYKTRWHQLAWRAATLAGATVTVLESSDAPDVILGWLLREGATLHYVFVREDHRRFGHARALLLNAGDLRRYTSRTSDWQSMFGKPRAHLEFLRRMTYDPSLLWKWFAPARPEEHHEDRTDARTEAHAPAEGR